MQKIVITSLFAFILTYCFGQKQRKASTYFMAQYNKTLYDVTKENNPWGIGLGFQAFLNNNTRLKPTVELTGDVYIDDKVYRTNMNGEEINGVGGMINFFAGTLFNLTKNIYVSFMGGPSFTSGQTLLGIKPSFGFYFPKSQNWTAKISYINVFNRDKTTKENFGSLSLEVGLKIF